MFLEKSVEPNTFQENFLILLLHVPQAESQPTASDSRKINN